MQTDNNESDRLTWQQLWIAFIAMLACTAGPFASDMYLPSLPQISQEFHVVDHIIQLTITGYLLGLSLSPLLYGPLSDRIGRRKTLLIGFTLALLGSILCTLAPSAHFLIAARMVQGIGVGAGACLFRAMLRDIFDSTRLSQVGSMAGMVFWLAPAIAPIVGGFIEVHCGWRMNFAVLLIYIISVSLLIAFCLPETNQKLSANAMQFKTMRANYQRLLKNRQFTTYVICSSMAFSGLIAYATTSPFIFEESLQLTPQHYGFLALYITVSALLGRLINSSIVRHFGIERLTFVGLIIMLVASIILISFVVMGSLNILAVMLPTSLFIIGSSFVFTNAMAGAFSPFSDIAGSASALFGCIQMSTPFLVSGCLAILHAKSIVALAGVYFCLASIALSVFYFSLWKNFNNKGGLASETKPKNNNVS